MKMKNTHHNSDRAAKSIRTKFDTITNWIESSIPIKKDAEGNELFKDGEPIYIEVPTSVNKFLRWSDVEAGILSTGQNALINYLSTHDKDKAYVENLLKQLEQKLQTQKLARSRSNLTKQLGEAWKLIDGQNKDITKYLIEIKDLKDELKSLKAEQENIELSASLRTEALEKKVHSLNEQLSRLRKLRTIDGEK